MIAPKSFEWRGYVFAASHDGWHVLPPGSYKPFGWAEDFENAKGVARRHAKQALAEAQEQYDRLMEPDAKGETP